MNSDGGFQKYRQQVSPVCDPAFLMLSFPPASLSEASAISHGPPSDTSYFHGLLLFNIVMFIIFPSWSVSTFRVATVANNFFYITSYTSTMPCRKKILNQYLLINHLEHKDLEHKDLEYFFHCKQNHKTFVLILYPYNTSDGLCPFSLNQLGN